MEEYNLMTNEILRLDMSCQFHSKNYEKAIEIYNSLKTNVQILPEDRKSFETSSIRKVKSNTWYSEDSKSETEEIKRK